jgi:tRNA-Thr(GGU) m(6)t(6)A37 methyltransferase TsaA
MFKLEPIGVIRSSRADPRDDRWDEETARVELSASYPEEAFDGLEDFSHVEVIFGFDQVRESEVERGARHPRGNTAWPRVGIFAQRAKMRPNRLGVTVARLQRREGRTLTVSGMDAIDGTPVFDVKPVMREFLPRGGVTQPSWVSELMSSYWGSPTRQVQLIPAPVHVEAAGSPPKVILEFMGRVSTQSQDFSVAQMKSPAGWSEPGQTPEFDELTVVLRGSLTVETSGATHEISSG